MKDFNELPTLWREQKEETTTADGVYKMPHPWIKDYFIVMEVIVTPTHEIVIVAITKAVSRERMKIVDRYPTYVELQAIRSLFFKEKEFPVIEVCDLDEYKLTMAYKKRDAIAFPKEEVPTPQEKEEAIVRTLDNIRSLNEEGAHSFTEGSEL